ncbi:MAG: hypothetical protein K8T10_16310 [Candidatus Eremiobacteraeota bacterium]|nr:hypothetical protein [Candidatus Eremiobacteraeota bacterium]
MINTNFNYKTWLKTTMLYASLLALELSVFNFIYQSKAGGISQSNIFSSIVLFILTFISMSVFFCGFSIFFVYTNYYICRKIYDKWTFKQLLKSQFNCLTEEDESKALFHITLLVVKVLAVILLIAFFVVYMLLFLGVIKEVY